MPYSADFPAANPDDDCDCNDPDRDPSCQCTGQDAVNGPWNSYADSTDELDPQSRREMIEALKENPPDFDDMSDGCLRAIHDAWLAEVSRRGEDHLQANPSPTHRSFCERDPAMTRFRSMSKQELCDFIGKNPRALQSFSEAQAAEFREIVRAASRRPARFSEVPPIPRTRKDELLAQTPMGRQLLRDRQR